VTTRDTADERGIPLGVAFLEGFRVESDTAKIDRLPVEYRRTLMEIDACRVEVGGSRGRWNDLARRLENLQLALREDHGDVLVLVG
jgi:hypothetical protein